MVKMVCNLILQRGNYYYSIEDNQQKSFPFYEVLIVNFLRCDLLWHYLDFCHVKMCVLVELH